MEGQRSLLETASSKTWSPSLRADNVAHAQSHVPPLLHLQPVPANRLPRPVSNPSSSTTATQRKQHVRLAIDGEREKTRLESRLWVGFVEILPSLYSRI